MRDVVLLALTGLFTLIALRRPLVGMLAFVSLSILGPHSFTWGIARTFPHSQFVRTGDGRRILAFVGGEEFSARARSPPRASAMGTCHCVHLVRSRSPIKRGISCVFVSKIFLMMFLCTAIVNTPERLHLSLVRVIALSLGFLALKTGLFVLLTGFQEKVYGPENTYLFQENAIGIALSANLPLLVYLLRVERARWLRWTIGAMFLLSYPAVVGTFSRGAWLSLGVVSALLVLFSRRRILAIGLVLVLATRMGSPGRVLSCLIE